MAALVLALLFLLSGSRAQTLPLPARPENAPGGREFAEQVAGLPLAEREREACAQVLAGNVPGFLRQLRPVSVTNTAAGQTNTATFHVTPDYLAIGSDADYLLMPVSPNAAQRLADALGCSLPTRKMVDAIYRAAELKLSPTPIPPSSAMTSVMVFSNHNATVWTQRVAQLAAHPLGALVAGHKKDVVLSSRLASAPEKVAIYGWHQTNGAPIQPLYLGHTAAWVDYSQCTRLVHRSLQVNGREMTVTGVLTNPALCGLLSDEGVVANPRYPTNALPAPSGLTVSSNAVPQARFVPKAFTGFEPGPCFEERVASFTFDPEVKIHINAPPEESFAPGKKVLLLFYSLPNGNTTEQTIGKLMRPEDDWHYDIQHIGAQTRFLRELLPERAIVVCYLEAAQRSWPAWRKKNGDKTIPAIVSRVKELFAGHALETALSGHSGGGSFLFGYLNAVEAIPRDVVRIAFLDSNYAYDRTLGHQAKLTQWLKTSPQHALCVLAYNDAVALLEGKTFVSAAGGTWGKSHEMLRDLGEEFQFTSRTNAGLEQHAALEGRLQFLLKENPEKKIFHTEQVERNGFIHCVVSGTPSEGQGYQYFGPRAYSRWIK